MVVESYKFIVGTERSKDNKSHTIKEINRTNYMTQEFMKLSSEYCLSIIGGEKNAILYAGGPAIHHSDGRNINGLLPDGSIAIKSQIGLNIYSIAKNFRNVNFSYANINGNTCASGMHSIYEAYKLIHNEGYDKVIVYASDLVEASQLLVFEQLGIDIVCGDGLAIIVFARECENPIAKVENVHWAWNLDPSPMTVTKEGYGKILNLIIDNTLNIDYIKPHGTGTGRNEIAENDALAEKNLNNIPIVKYKEQIGHTQGASAAIELCMVLNDNRIDSNKNILITASGLGGFYGGCIVSKI